MKNMTYKELVEDLNKDLRALNSIEKPLAIYKEEKELVAERIK